MYMNKYVYIYICIYICILLYLFIITNLFIYRWESYRDRGIYISYPVDTSKINDHDSNKESIDKTSPAKRADNISSSLMYTNGSYVDDNNGCYVDDNNGSYVDDNNGCYVDDNNGSYVDDNNGSYVDDNNLVEINSSHDNRNITGYRSENQHFKSPTVLTDRSLPLYTSSTFKHHEDSNKNDNDYSNNQSNEGKNDNVNASEQKNAKIANLIVDINNPSNLHERTPPPSSTSLNHQVLSISVSLIICMLTLLLMPSVFLCRIRFCDTLVVICF
jgi:hypothetical protein